MRSSVYRTRPMTKGSIRGDFVVTEALVHATRRALVEFRDADDHSVRHEGLVFWGGMELDGTTLLTTAIVPESDHSSSAVFVSEAAVGAAARCLRQYGLGLLCQVHSHPGWSAQHSDGDDKLIILPFEGMLSIVVPYFGRGFKSLLNAHVHQYQDGRWVLCSPQSVQRRIHQVPTVVNVR